MRGGNEPKGVFLAVAREQPESSHFVLDARHDRLDDGELGAQSHGGQHHEEEDRPHRREGHLGEGLGVDYEGQTRS